ncbi:hypothetical protein [Streptomyces sp. NPDC048650]|uniref:hypothetical protein n=1 Tax=unclassified Streptomyces TaxID=2593676 RepID=UPI00372091D8
MLDQGQDLRKQQMCEVRVVLSTQALLAKVDGLLANVEPPVGRAVRLRCGTRRGAAGAPAAGLRAAAGRIPFSLNGRFDD